MLDKKTRTVSKLETINYEQDVWNGVPIDEEFYNFYAITYLKVHEELSRKIYIVRFNDEKKDIVKNITNIIHTNNIQYSLNHLGWYHFDEPNFDHLFSILVEDYKNYKNQFTESSNVISQIAKYIKDFETLIKDSSEEIVEDKINNENKVMIEKKRVSFPNEKVGCEDEIKDVWNGVVIDEKFLSHFGIKSFENHTGLGRNFNFIQFLDKSYLENEIVPILIKENIHFDLRLLGNSLVLSEEDCDKLFQVFIDNYKVSNELEELNDMIKSKDTKDALENIKTIKEFILGKELHTSKLEQILEDVKSNNKNLSDMFESVKEMKNNQEETIDDELDLLTENIEEELLDLKIHTQEEKRDVIVSRVLSNIKNGKEPHKSDLDTIYALETTISILKKIETPFTHKDRILREFNKQIEERTLIETRVLSSIRNGKEPHKADLNSIYALSVAILSLERMK